MSIWGWLNREKRNEIPKERPVPTKPDLAPEEKSVFQTILEDIHQEYVDELKKSAARVADLEALVGQLEDESNAKTLRIAQLEKQITLTLEKNKEKGPYENEEGPSISLMQALDVLRTAAEKDNPMAQFYLGVSYAFGIDRKRNSLLGEQWLVRSASQQNSAIYYLLGVLKHQGILLDRGPQQSLHWMLQAHKNGLNEIERYIDGMKAEVRKIEKEQEELRKIRREQRGQESLEEEKKQNDVISNTATPSFFIDLGSLSVNRTSSFSSAWNFPEDSYSSMELKAYKRGHQCGIECLKKAIRFSKLMSSKKRFSRNDIKSIAKRFAMRRGYLQHTINEGMEGLFPDHLVTPKVRDAFIKGVNYSILSNLGVRKK